MVIAEVDMTGLAGSWKSGTTRHKDEDGNVWCRRGHLLTGTGDWVYIVKPSSSQWRCRRCLRGATNRAPSHKLKYHKQAGPKPLWCEACCIRFAVVRDHDHTTGNFRGWVCNQCNILMGMGQDDPEVIRRVASWLETKKKASP